LCRRYKFRVGEGEEESEGVGEGVGEESENVRVTTCSDCRVLSVKREHWHCSHYKLDVTTRKSTSLRGRDWVTLARTTPRVIPATCKSPAVLAPVSTRVGAGAGYVTGRLVWDY